jgi:hypothetical protein
VERVALQPARPPTPSNMPPVVIPKHGMGGNLLEHKHLFSTYRTYGLSVELRGPCYSACTILTAYVGKDKLCIGEGAFMAFHAVRAGPTGPRMDDATIDMVRSFPPEIQRWIDRHGGAEKLPRPTCGRWATRGASDPDRGRPATVITLGDYVDRGPKSRQVIERLMDWGVARLEPGLPQGQPRRHHVAVQPSADQGRMVDG